MIKLAYIKIEDHKFVAKKVKYILSIRVIDNDKAHLTVIEYSDVRYYRVAYLLLLR